MEGTLKILIVDDNINDRMTVRRNFNATDLQVQLVEANDCAEALSILEQQSVDCVFLAYHLPDGNALEFVQELRDAGVQIPLIVLTLQVNEEVAGELMQAGASDYCSKEKMSPAQLSQLVSNTLRVYRAEEKVLETNRLLQERNEILRLQNRQLEKQQQQIQLQNLQLLEASHLKSQFLAAMSHELRTPMHAIMGFSQILLQRTKGPLIDAQAKMVKRILDNSASLLKLLDDILDFAKIDSGHMELNLKQFNVAKLILASTEEIRSLADQKKLQLQVDLNLQNRQVVTDPGRLKQVLINLLANAIKFTQAGGIRVEVNELPDDQFAIAIHDTGIGIELDKMDYIFDAFRQADQTVTRKHPGTGLGLAIAKSLVQMMQGEIKVESQVGKGSTFEVVLPRQISSDEHDLNHSTPLFTIPSSSVTH